MAEYFKRVDIARTEYATLNDADGMKTDRGKVFILNGKPATVVKNVLDGDILQEIWKYNAPQNTTYYFETPRSKQSYKLTKIVN
ncbi:MAG: GWxTD domain-containing protein, partial [Candidatus Kapabacteria bacterium]|nr:GWxTD domain-containing protein [Candidatus Kapabacteria bacterium]